MPSYFQLVGVAMSLAGLLPVYYGYRRLHQMGSAARAAAEGKFGAIVQQVADRAILMITPLGEIETWNQGATRLFGYGAAEMAGRSVAQLFGTRPAPAVPLPRMLAGAAAAGRLEERVWCRRKDGSRFAASAVTEAVHDDARRLVGFVHVIRDLDRERIGDGGGALGGALQNIADLTICVLDAGGIIRSTAGARDGAALAGRPLAALYPPADAACGRPEAALKQAAERGRHDENAWRTHSDGRLFWAACALEPIRDPGGAPAGFTLVMRDITEQRSIELALMDANRDLKRRNDELQRFYHTVSHELKTPLTGAREFVAIVRDGLGGAVNDEQRNYLKLALDACDQLKDQINDLLDSTRLDTGMLQVQRAPTALAELIEQVVATFRPRAAAGGLNLAWHVQAGLPPVPLDRHRFFQVLANLLSNALKATPPGGQVQVRAHGDPENAGEVIVEVADSGKGIAPEHLERIFERLYQVSDGEFSTSGGLGLGLYIARAIVQLHGGRISAHSVPGAGSTFQIRVPIADSVTAAAAEFPEKPFDAPDLQAAIRRAAVSRPAA